MGEKAWKELTFGNLCIGIYPRSNYDLSKDIFKKRAFIILYQKVQRTKTKPNFKKR